ncbi:hypothetical protein N9414_13415 [Nodularia spumigena CCY9414]|nr:hypothetical protein N9414_13415 [Nodularia spumigena CCY9414]
MYRFKDYTWFLNRRVGIAQGAWLR